jgi:hypothetical protein
MPSNRPNTKQAVQIGPFTGGLNNISTAGEARDTEVVDLVNLEVSVDTSLTSRPPIEAIAGSTLPTTNTIGWDVLGIYRVTTAEWYLIVTVPKDGTTNTDTTVKAYLNGVVGTGESVTIIKQCVGINNRVTSMVQFKDKIFFNVDSTATDRGFWWQKGAPLGGTTVAAMPRGNVMISWKTRLWIGGTGQAADGDTVWFSTIDASGPKPDTWGANDYFNVAPGEGGFITAMVPSFNNLIIFKNDGTWRFSFPSQPAKGVVDKISGDVGCAGKNAVVDFENYMYVYDQGRVYEMVNSNFSQLNRFVNFSEDSLSVDSVATGVELSVVNRRLLVRYFNNIYCFSIDAKAWCQWRTYAGTPGKFIGLPADSNSSSPSLYIGASRGTNQSASSNSIQDASFTDSTISAARAAVTGGSVTYSGVNATLTTTGTSQMYLNTTGSSTDYDVPVSTSQVFTAKCTVASLTGTACFTLTYLYATGATSTANTANLAVGANSIDITIPAGAILANISVNKTNAGQVTFSAPEFARKATTSPKNLMRILDQYKDQAAAIEYIDCYFQTKSYDYKSPGNFKQLYWAGIDVKTTRIVKTEVRPVSKYVPITWGQLDSYTWTQLEQGVWENPLSWLNVSTAVFNYLDADEVMSENGRYFKKLGKALRFRQISYIVRMSSFGTLKTGPVKFFTLTTFVATKQDVVDSST